MKKPTRRALLFSGLAAGGLTLWNTGTISTKILTHKGRDWGLCDKETDNEKDISYLAEQQEYDVSNGYDQIYGQRQYTLVGETDHTDKRVDDFFYNPANIQTMASSGIKHLCLEKDLSKQPTFDRLANGTLLPEEYARAEMPEAIETDFDQYLFDQNLKFAQAIRAMKQLGIMVHCVDPQQQEDKQTNPAANEFIFESREFHTEMCQTPEGITASAETAFGFFNMFRGFSFVDDLKAINDLRADDRKRLQIIQGKCGDEPTVIFFGNDHFETRTNSFKQLLGQNALHLSIFGDQRYYEAPKYNMNPDFVHLVQEGAVFKMPNADMKGLYQRPRSRPLLKTASLD